MNNTNLKNDNNIPELIIKLCKALASDDENLELILIEKSFSFLSNVHMRNSTTNLNNGENATEHEQFICNQIRGLLRKKSSTDAEKFELLYSNISKSKLFKDRAMLLSFLYNVAINKNDGLIETSHAVYNDQRKLSLNNLPSNDTTSHRIRTLCGTGEMKLTNSNAESSTIQLKSHSTSTPIQIQSTYSNYDNTRITPSTSSNQTTLYPLNEFELIEDVIYILQGIPGKFFRKETCIGNVNNYPGFTLDPKIAKMLFVKDHVLIERIMEISFLHNQLKQYCDSCDKHNGMICQAFTVALNFELSEYYKTIALLQLGLNKESKKQQCDLTLRKVLYAVQDWRKRFEWLSYITEQCNDKKGGELITVVYGFMQHGAPTAQQISEKVLKAVCKPFYNILSKWLLNGEINDSSNEYFIESKHIMSAERLWYDKYSVRKMMIPSFISLEQAKRILAIGKGINFLREICHDNGELPGKEALQDLFRGNSAEALFKPELSIEFHSKLEKIYKETSLHLLDLLKNKFKLYEHLQSLRRYLLLGQGDFIRHLLELLTPELNKMASEIYGHNLSSIVETAIHVTNAQYENEDTLKRLTVRCMSDSYGDSGWDIFSLVYVVDGPIGTILQPTMPSYQSLFGALWKAKRIEFLLANMRRQQLEMAKLFRKDKELKPVMHIIYILTGKMIHFIHQTQYYFLFEVLECSWAEMQEQVDRADGLDKIIEAHSEFLTSIRCGVLLDEDSRQLFSHLISIYNLVVNLEIYQDAIYKYAIETYCMEDYTIDKIAYAKRSQLELQQFLIETKLKVKTMAETYDTIVVKFLELLAANSNVKLQLLSVRLNFNDFYKIA